MATYNVVKAKSATLTISTVDTVNFSRTGDRLIVFARGAATDFISFTFVGPGSVAPDPTALGDDCFVIMGGQSFTYPIDGDLAIAQVKLISAQAAPYTVMATT